MSQRAPAKNNRSFCAGGDCGPTAPVATQAPFSPAPAQRSQPDTTVCSGEEGPASQKGAQAPIVSTARRCHSFGAPAALEISRFFFWLLCGVFWGKSGAARTAKSGGGVRNCEASRAGEEKCGIWELARASE